MSNGVLIALGLVAWFLVVLATAPAALFGGATPPLDPAVGSLATTRKRPLQALPRGERVALNSHVFGPCSASRLPWSPPR